MNRKDGFLKGTIVGMFNIIPGISGGTIAVVFEIYTRLIEAVDMLSKSPIKAIKHAWDIFLGIIIGLAGSFLVFSYGYGMFPLAITLMFIGLLVGGLNPITSKLKGKISTKNIIILVISFIIIILMPLLPTKEFGRDNSLYYLLLFLAGVLSAIAGFSPGISGSLMLIVLGYYGHILGMGREIFDGLLNMHITPLLDNLLAIIMIFIGLVIGFVISIKLVKYLLSKFETEFYFSVFGMVLASPITVMAHLHKEIGLKTFNIREYIVGFILMLFGIVVSYKVVSSSESKERQESISES